MIELDDLPELKDAVMIAAFGVDAAAAREIAYREISSLAQADRKASRR